MIIKAVRILFFIFTLIAIQNEVFGQNKIDSLKALLNKSEGAWRVELLNEISQSYLYKDNVESRRYAYKALKQAEKVGYSHRNGKILYTIGQTYLIHRLYDSAINYLQQSLNYYEIPKDVEEIALVESSLGFLFKRSHHHDSAFVHFFRAQEIYDTIRKKSKHSGNNCLYIGNTYKIRGDYPNAIHFYKKGLESFVAVDYKNGIASILNNLGFVYYELSDYNTAVEHYRQALEIKYEMGDSSLASSTLNNLGLVFYEWGNYQKAIDYYEEAIRVNRKSKNESTIAIYLNNQALVYLDWKKYNLALEYHLQCLDIRRKINDIEGIASSLNNIGSVYLRLDSVQKALVFFNESIDIKRELGNKKDISVTLNNIGVVYEKAGMRSTALKYYKEAYKLRLESDDLKGQAKSLYNIGAIYQQRGQHLQAIETFNKALIIAKNIKRKILLSDLYKDISGSYSSIGEIEKANKALWKYVNIQDSLFSQENRERITEMESRFRYEQKESEIEILKKESKIQILEIEKHESEAMRQKTLAHYLILLSIIVTIAFILLFNWFQLKQKNRQSELENRTMQIEQQLMRAQMNPHFIFNSLNSIQSYISENKSYLAESYLSKFARLIRYILENSRQPYVLLEDDVQTIKLQLDLEKIRFKNKFDYEIIVDEDIDAEFMEIPPMLIQPFIENALIHGIMNKTEGDGRIVLHYDLDESIIVCTILDNGVGRKKSAELKKLSRKKHQSLGMKVTNERLELLRKETQLDIDFEIIDLFDKRGNATGTKVIVKIPVIDSV